MQALKAPDIGTLRFTFSCTVQLWFAITSQLHEVGTRGSLVLAIGFEPTPGLLRLITSQVPSTAQPSQHLNF
jgi:hypothetical protein